MITILSYGKHKNIKIKSNFETDSTIDETLIIKLQALKESNERLSMLLEMQRKNLVFRDINELIRDTIYFEIVKKYENVFKKMGYIEKLYQSNLAVMYESNQKLKTQLNIRKLALTLLTDNPIINEIINKMIHSFFTYQSIECFKLEVNFRWNAISLMNNEVIHHDKNKFRYPTNEINYLQLNEKYWERPDKSKGYFIIRKGVQPSAAINSIFDECRVVVLECHSMMLSIQYKALLNTIGNSQFDLFFKQKPIVISDGFYLNFNHECFENVNEIFIHQGNIKKDELIPGDWIYLANFIDYNKASLYDDSKDGAGLHSMVMGDNKYRGFGLSKPMSEDEIKKQFLKMYNEDFRAYPLELVDESIDEETMGLECQESHLKEGDEVVIYGHILCPEYEWSKVVCIYKGEGRFYCEKLMVENATENEVVLELLKMHNSVLPKKKTDNDLLALNIFRGLSTNVRRINLLNEGFKFHFQNNFVYSNLSNSSSALFTNNIRPQDAINSEIARVILFGSNGSV